MTNNSSFGLTRSDYFALIALTFTACGGVAAYIHVSNQALQNKLQGELRVVNAEIRADLRKISDNVDQTGSDMQSVVNAALEARTDEVLLAITRLTDMASGFTVSVSNLDLDSQAFQSIDAYAATYGRETRKFIILDKAHVEVTLDEITGHSALALQEVIEAIPRSEWAGTAVKIAPHVTSGLIERMEELVNSRKLEELSGELEGLGFEFSR